MGRIKDELAGNLAVLCKEWRKIHGVNEQEFAQAQKRGRARRRTGYAVAARYDPVTSRIVVSLNTGLELAFPPSLAEGLAGASTED